MRLKPPWHLLLQRQKSVKYHKRTNGYTFSTRKCFADDYDPKCDGDINVVAHLTQCEDDWCVTHDTSTNLKDDSKCDNDDFADLTECNDDYDNIYDADPNVKDNSKQSIATARITILMQSH